MKINFSQKNSLLIILSLVLILLVSGCVGQTSLDTGTNGLIIRDLYTDPPSEFIETGDYLTIHYQIENVGGTVAENVYTTIFGFPWVSQEYCYPSCNDGLTLFPPDIVTGSLGGLEAVSFRIPIPENVIPPGVKQTFTPTIRVRYTYKSKASTILTGYSRQRYNRDIQLGNTQRVSQTTLPVQSTITGTPISVSISGPDKLVVPESEKLKQPPRYTYQITFSDTGQGHPITNGVPGLINVNLRIQGPGVFFENCIDNDDYNDQINTQVKLIGTSVTKSCTISIQNNKGSDSTWNDREFDTVNMFFDIDYEYFIEKDFPITISRSSDQEKDFI